MLLLGARLGLPMLNMRPNLSFNQSEEERKYLEATIFKRLIELSSCFNKVSPSEICDHLKE